MGGVVKAVGSVFSGDSPGTPVAAPAPPTANGDNTSAAVAAQANMGAGRSANISAGSGPSVNDTTSQTDQYSVRKKLLGY